MDLEIAVIYRLIMDLMVHRNDLRTSDNAALAKADDPVPIYILDPEWLEDDRVSDQRIEFVLESLKDLNRQYVEKGSHLVLRYGKTEKVLEELSPRFDRTLFNRDPNHFRRGLEERLRSRYTGISGSPVTEDIERSDWGERISEWFSNKLYEPPESLRSPALETDISIDEVRDRSDIDPDKERFGEGGTEKARRRLEVFSKRIERYAGSISSPSKAESNTSHLSPYIRYGCISPREVYQSVDKKADEGRSKQMFLDRIIWQQHFNRKLEDNPDLFREAINPVYRDLYRDSRDPGLVQAWKDGKTGYPLVDASMRALVETGWINFRMRAMCVSFYSYILKQWWREGADFFYRHLVDADVAINYYQWQMQSGLVGVHANRIYDPTKQVEENDPEGSFIRKYVPELRAVPDKFIAEPWKMPEKLQDDIGLEIGKNYPEPVIDYEREARRARKFFRNKAPQAYAAFRDDEVWRKASLSDRHSREEILEKAGNQLDLEEFIG